MNERRGGRPDRQVLNKDFYSATPHAYLMQRVTLLLALREKGEEVKKLLDPEFKVGEVELKTQSDTPEAEREIRHRFVIAESYVLLHHTAETLLRMYLAHADLSPEPAIVLAREYNFARFKEKVADLKSKLASGEETDRIHRVFHGGRSREDLRPHPDPNLWRAAEENIRTFLIRLAAVFLDSNAYNAAKHGLAVSAGMTALDVAVEEQSLWSASGPTLTYLALRPQGNHKEWERITRWFSPEHSIGITIASCHLLHLLWTVARHRYLGERGALPFLFDKPTLGEIEGPHGRVYQEAAIGLPYFQT